MPMRVSGINSGIDTDAAVRELVAAYSKKSEKVTQDQTKLSWKQEIWKGLNTKVYGLYTNISNLRYSGTYGLRKVTSSDASKASVSADGNAIVGSHKLNVLKTAQSAYLTGTKITTKDGGKVTAESKLSDLGVTSVDSTLRVTTKDADGNDVVKDIRMSLDHTVDDFVNELRKAGLNASFDEDNGRFFISAKNSGANGDFTITAADTKQIPTFDANGQVAKDSDGNVIYETISARPSDIALANSMLTRLGLGSGKALAGNDIRSASQSVPLTENSTMANLGYRPEGSLNTSLIEVKDANGSHGYLEIGQFTSMKDISRQLQNMGINAKFDVETKKDANGNDVKTGHFTFQDADGISFETMDANGLSALRALGLRGGVSSPDGQGNARLSDKLVDDLGLQSGSKIKFRAPDGSEQVIQINENTTMDIMVRAFRNRGFTDASYDETTGQFSFGNGNIGIGAFYADDEKGMEMLRTLGLTENLKQTETAHATKIAGQDAEIRLNGEIFTSSSNNFTINGLTINAQGVTGDGDENAININVSTDNQGIYDKVKDFLTQYNNIINEITKLYNAESSYGYNPLTDDEKESMSDSQIEKWETKIKDSLLRRDNTLNTIMSSMMSAMNKAITINGKSYNLTSFGIHTLGFLNAAENEQNAFHIDGDSEDENTAFNEEKLMKAINEDPDTVIEFMKQLSSNLYKALDDNMTSNSMRSKYKIYNDKEMDKQYANYTKKIKEWDDRIKAKEDFYYKKFTKMESAMGKLNSQTNYLAGLFGTK